MSAFLKALFDAKLAKETHELRTRQRVQSWFARHPECYYRVDHVTDEGITRRSNVTINIQAQYRPFDEQRMKVNPHVVHSLRRVGNSSTRADYFKTS